MELNYDQPQIYVSEKGTGSSYIKNPNYIPGCNSTRFIQRLKSPRKRSSSRSAFGGGLQRGGLSEKTWNSLNDICSFDYMGACEFETGALPEAMQAISSARLLEAYTLEVTGSPAFPRNVIKFRRYNSQKVAEIKQEHSLSATIFVIAPRAIRRHVDNVINRIVSEDENFLKERTHLRKTIFCPWYWTDMDEDKWDFEATKGWIELNNGFMFFSCEDMWRSFCRLFLPKQPDFDIQVTQADFTEVDKALENCL